MVAVVDVEGLLVTVLSTLAPTSTKVPATRPTRFIRVTRTGGPRTLLTDSPTVLVECWDVRGVDAFSLAAEAVQLIESLDGSTVGSAWVESVYCDSPVSFPDPLSETPRYQFVAQVATRKD